MRKMLLVVFLAMVCAAQASPVSVNTLKEYVARFNADDEEIYTNSIPNALAEKFLVANVPLFECPDKEIERTYYFRWWTYRKHLKETPEGWVVTEFLPPVSWARTYNGIICAMGHHVMEGRWLRDNRFLDDYARFWFKGSGKKHNMLYTCWPAFSLAERARVIGDRTLLAELLDPLVAYMDRWDAWYGKTPPGHGPEYRLAFSHDSREGSEISCGGHGLRPLINSAIWGEATTLANVARELNRSETAEHCEKMAALYGKSITELMWHKERQSFTVISTNGVHQTVRELHGFMPWYVKMPLKGYEAAWAPLMDAQNGFFGKFGLTVPERSAPGFVLDYTGHDCKWNGPSWPFATAFTLSALANALHAGYELPVTKADYVKVLRQYAAQHVRKTEKGNTVCWIDENLNPDTGEWLAREIIIRQKRGPRERGKDYNHSTYCDLVIAGLVGIVPQDGNTLVVDPLFPREWEYLGLENIRYHGHDVSVRWDRTGDRYGKKGFMVLMDGKPVAHASAPERLDITLPGAK
jgi:hypothetical protein